MSIRCWASLTTSSSPRVKGRRSLSLCLASCAKSSNVSRYQIAFPLYLGAQYDATTTNLSYHIPNPSSGGKPAELTVSFLSPITPTSSLRQSIPASYISVYVEGDFDIDFYMDLNGDWVSGDGNSMIRWYLQSVEFDENGALWSWQVQKEADQEFAEFADRAEWGRLHFTGPTVRNPLKYTTRPRTLLTQRAGRKL